MKYVDLCCCTICRLFTDVVFVQVRPAAKQALEVLSETLKPVSSERVDDSGGVTITASEEEELWGAETASAVALTSLDMEVFLTGWSSGSTTLNYDANHRTYTEKMGSVDSARDVEWKQQWSERANGIKKPAYT